MGSWDLPDMYALSPRASGMQIRQNPSCPCYNLYLFPFMQSSHDKYHHKFDARRMHTQLKLILILAVIYVATESSEKQKLISRD